MRRLTPTILETCLAGLLVCAAFAFPDAAQTNSTSPANPSGQNAEPLSQTSPAQPVTKKVWTNDDVNGLRADSPISTIGKPARPAKDGAKQTNPKAKGAAWYQGRIAKLQAELPPIDDQIAQLRAALDGQTVNSVRKWGGVKPDDWRVELDNLQKKHDDIEAQIAALKDEARHDGVPPSALP
jgi:hypothetical protein